MAEFFAQGPPLKSSSGLSSNWRLLMHGLPAQHEYGMNPNKTKQNTGEIATLNHVESRCPKPKKQAI